MTAADYLPVNPVPAQPNAWQSSQQPVQGKLRNVLILTHSISSSSTAINNFGSKYPIASLEVTLANSRLLLHVCVLLNFCPTQFSAFPLYLLRQSEVIHTSDTGYLQSQTLIQLLNVLANFPCSQVLPESTKKILLV